MREKIRKVSMMKRLMAIVMAAAMIVAAISIVPAKEVYAALSTITNVRWGNKSAGENETTVYFDPVQGATRYDVSYAAEHGGGKISVKTTSADLMRNISKNANDGDSVTVSVYKIDAYNGDVKIASVDLELNKTFSYERITTPTVYFDYANSKDTGLWKIRWDYYKENTYYLVYLIDAEYLDEGKNTIMYSNKYIAKIEISNNNFSSKEYPEGYDGTYIYYSEFADKIEKGKSYAFLVQAMSTSEPSLCSKFGYCEFTYPKYDISLMRWTEMSNKDVYLSWGKVDGADSYLIYDINSKYLNKTSECSLLMNDYLNSDMSKNDFYIIAYKGSEAYSNKTLTPTFDYGIAYDFPDETLTYKVGDAAKTLTFEAHDSCHGGITNMTVYCKKGESVITVNKGFYKTTNYNRNGVAEKYITFTPLTSSGEVVEYYVVAECKEHGAFESTHTKVIVYEDFKIKSSSGDVEIFEGSNEKATVEVTGTGVSCEWKVDGATKEGSANGNIFSLPLSELSVGDHAIVATLTDIKGTKLTQNYSITVKKSNGNETPLKIKDAKVNGYVSSDNALINIHDINYLLFTYNWDKTSDYSGYMPMVGDVLFTWDLYELNENGELELTLDTKAVLTIESEEATLMTDEIYAAAADKGVDLDENKYAVIATIENTIIVNEKKQSRYGIVVFYLDFGEPDSPDVSVSYATHIQSLGDSQGWKKDGEMAGTSGMAKRLENIKITVSGNANLGIQYTTHCQSYGWMTWSANGELNGTSGEAKRLEAIKIQLTGEDKNKYDVYYRVHAQSYGWLGWAKNGEPSGTAGYAKRLEGIQIVIKKKGEPAPGVDYADVKASGVAHNSMTYIKKTEGTIVIPGNEDSANVSYRTHVQSIGWQSWKLNGSMSGTSGEAKRLEGINVKISNCDVSGGIRYMTHIQSYGWTQGWKSDGAMAGTSGEGKRLEAIKIELTGDMAKYYDVYYRVHAQSFGWLAWAKNGEESGTAGYGKRLEGIQIVLVRKGEAAPGKDYADVKPATVNEKAYISK